VANGGVNYEREVVGSVGESGPALGTQRSAYRFRSLFKERCPHRSGEVFSNLTASRDLGRLSPLLSQFLPLLVTLSSLPTSDSHQNRHRLSLYTMWDAQMIA